MNRTRWTATLALVLICWILALFSPARAQGPNPTTPGYVTCSNWRDGGATGCPWQSAGDFYQAGAIAATSQTVTIPLNNRSTVGLSITGTWSGALTIRASVDYAYVGPVAATWITTTAVPVATGAPVTSISGDGLYQINASGFSAVQVIGTSIVSGTANVAMVGSQGVSTIMADNPIPVTLGITAVTHAISTALANNLTVKAVSGNLLGYNCTAITGGAAGYCVAYNSATVPATGALVGSNVLDYCYFDITPRGCSLSRVPVSALYPAGIQILVTTAASPYTYTTGTDTAAISADYQ